MTARDTGWDEAHTELVCISQRLIRYCDGRAQVLTIKNSDIAKHLSLPPVKLHCSMLAEDAIKAAVRDIKARRTAWNGPLWCMCQDPGASCIARFGPVQHRCSAQP